MGPSQHRGLAGWHPRTALLAWLLVWLLLGSAFTRSVLAANTAALPAVEVSPWGQDPLTLTPFVQVLEDPGGTLTLADVQTPALAQRFASVPAPERPLGFGTTSSAYWLKMRLHNSSDQAQDLMLEVAYARLAHLDFHQQTEGQTYQSTATGSLHPFAQRPYPHHFFVLPISLDARADLLADCGIGRVDYGGRGAVRAAAPTQRLFLYRGLCCAVFGLDHRHAQELWYRPQYGGHHQRNSAGLGHRDAAAGLCAGRPFQRAAPGKRRSPGPSPGGPGLAGGALDGTLRISATATENVVEMQFADDGCGMDADTLARIFEPFFTTRLGQGGSGLGLSVSLNIANGLLGGSLSAQSKAGGGSCFTLSFPRMAPAIAP